MANPIYDIAAISTDSAGDPAVQYVLHTFTGASGSLRIAEFSETVHTILGSAGWTTLSSTSDAHGTNYVMHGLQSPWFDEDNIPDWYTENVPWLRTICNSDLNIKFQVGMYNGTAGTYTSTDTTLLVVGQPGSSELGYFIASPYQIFIRRAGAAQGFMMSAIHIPDFVQERVQVKNCMIANENGYMNRLDDANNGSWILYESNQGTAAEFREGGLNSTARLVVQVGGGIVAAQEGGKWIWNPTDTATDLVSATTWHPFMSPPTIAWAQADNTSTIEAYGMLWDSLLVTKQYSLYDVVSGLPEKPTAERRDWLCVGRSGAGGDTAYNASLIAIKGFT